MTLAGSTIARRSFFVRHLKPALALVPAVFLLSSRHPAAQTLVRSPQGGNTGEAVFEQACSTCHGAAASAGSRAPGMETLRLQTPESVLDVLTTAAAATCCWRSRLIEGPAES